MSVIINVFLYFQLFYGTLLQEMWQIKETNKDISKFFKNLNLPYKSDTIFVFIFKPGVAPRIEAGINPFIKYLRKQRIKNDIIIFAISNKKKAAEKYLKRSGFDADYQYVVNEKFLKFFEFSTGVFLGPFACKFSISKGELISSFPLTAKIDSQTVSEFIKDFSCPKVKKAHLTPPIKKIGKESKINIIKKIRLYENEEYPLSSPLFISVSPLRNYLAITDQMTQLIYIFDLSSGKFINLLYPDSLEEKMFINLSEKEYSSLKKFFKSMYFNHCFYNDSILLITASLPAVKKEIKNSDTIIAYLNEPCLVLKEIFFNKIKKLNSFSLPTPNFNHISASFVVETKMIFLPFRKGWPYGITMLNEKIPVEDNPFRKEFYEKDLHLVGIFNFEGEFIGFLGKLSKYMEDLKIGYSGNLESFVRFYKENYYLTDRVSGKIYKYDKNFNLLDSIDVFEINLSIPQVDYTKEPLKYILEAVRNNFFRYIIDFFIDDDICYVLLKEHGFPFLYEINRKNNEIRKTLLPTKVGKEGKINYYFLNKINKEVSIIAILEDADKTFYCEVKVIK